jgi:hypothetical protein
MLSEPLRTAIVSSSNIISMLPVYLQSYPVFTRRPVPGDAVYPMILISPDITVTDQDGVNDQRPVYMRDVAAYGLNNTPTHYRTVEDIGAALRELFHRNRTAISVSGWGVIDIIAHGPRPAPVDDNDTVGRVVSLTIRLARL